MVYDILYPESHSLDEINSAIRRGLRDRLICAALAGLAANCRSDYNQGPHNYAVASRAIALADAVLELMDKGEV